MNDERMNDEKHGLLANTTINTTVSLNTRPYSQINSDQEKTLFRNLSEIQRAGYFRNGVHGIQTSVINGMRPVRTRRFLVVMERCARGRDTGLEAGYGARGGHGRPRLPIVGKPLYVPRHHPAVTAVLYTKVFSWLVQ